MKILRSSSIRRAEAALYLVVFFQILLFSAMTPMLADDYSYCFSWADNRRITSPLQIPASMAVHRQLTNGRVIPHALVQLVLLACPNHPLLYPSLAKPHHLRHHQRHLHS